MDANRVYSLLATASSEITMLRRQVDTLRPKAEAYDVIARMWRDPGKENGWGVDVHFELHFELQRAMEEIHAGFQREKENMDRSPADKINQDLNAEKRSFDEYNLRRAMKDFGLSPEMSDTNNRPDTGMRIDDADRPD